MTILYKQVLIESVEQADALPEGAILFDGDPEYGVTYVRAADDWYTGGFPHHALSKTLRAGLDVTALVPIEAEEEESGAKGDGESEDFYLVRRLVTRWEEA